MEQGIGSSRDLVYWLLSFFRAAHIWYQGRQITASADGERAYLFNLAQHHGSFFRAISSVEGARVVTTPLAFSSSNPPPYNHLYFQQDQKMLTVGVADVKGCFQATAFADLLDREGRVLLRVNDAGEDPEIRALVATRPDLRRSFNEIRGEIERSLETAFAFPPDGGETVHFVDFSHPLCREMYTWACGANIVRNPIVVGSLAEGLHRMALNERPSACIANARKFEALAAHHFLEGRGEGLETKEAANGLYALFQPQAPGICSILDLGARSLDTSSPSQEEALYAAIASSPVTEKCIVQALRRGAIPTGKRSAHQGRA